MRFDTFSIAILVLREDAPDLDEKALDDLQDAHMSHLADLHEAGYLLAAGPLLGGPDSELRGLSILNVEPDKARELKASDPAVRAGRYSVTVLPWMVPAGAMAFSKTRFPRSAASLADE
jgi:uncharacterized protein YciI